VVTFTSKTDHRVLNVPKENQTLSERALAEGLLCYPQERWTSEMCAAAARIKGKDGYGSTHPYAGLIQSDSTPRPRYGIYTPNGGAVLDGEWYPGAFNPWPELPDDYEIIVRSSWGYYIRKKETT